MAKVLLLVLVLGLGIAALGTWRTENYLSNISPFVHLIGTGV